MQPSPCKEFLEVFVCILRLLRTVEVGAAVCPICLIRIVISLTSATLGFVRWEHLIALGTLDQEVNALQAV